MTKKTYYVCSYGGSGSKMLCSALSKYGNVRHIHSRYPPEKLEYIGSENNTSKVYHEWFNGVKINEDKLDNYEVIYIYRNPVKAILSRFDNPRHLMHIQLEKYASINDVINSGEDKFAIEEFYNNYTTKNDNRNYKIHCVRYEDIFDKQDELSELLGIGSLGLIKKETNRDINIEIEKSLNKIYKNLINRMNKNKSIFTI
jgi:hypothetical protein